MNWELLFVFGLTVAAVAMFATERLRSDMVAILVMVALLLSRIVTPEEGLAGFANTATVTVAAMFILSAGLFRTGAVKLLGFMLDRLANYNPVMMILVMMIGVAVISAFLNNTATVAIFIPVIMGVARKADISASRLLMPLSFASMLGGISTLVGTSTNILASTIIERYGYEPLGMFEFTRLGAIFFLVGVVYMLLIGIRLIPERRRAGDLTETFGMGEYLTDLVLLPDAKSAGKTIATAPLTMDLGVAIIEIVRGGRKILLPTGQTVLKANDILRIKGDIEKIARLKNRAGVAFTHEGKWQDLDLDSRETQLVEAVIAPNSPLAGKTLSEVRFRHRYGGAVMAIRHSGHIVHESLENIPLSPGDVLLIDERRQRVDMLRQDHSFVLVSKAAIPSFRPRRMLHALLIVTAVIVLASMGVVPIVVGAVSGAVLMVMLGCLDAEEAYAAIDWKILFLLAGLLTLGTAMEKTGAAGLVASQMVSFFGDHGPRVLISAFYLATMVLTSAMSNNATVALLGPIAIDAALSLGLNPRPFLITVMIAASSSFMTPVGYQTNTMIYGPGQYRFSDFIKVGTPLNVMLWVLATIFIPLYWPP